MAMRIVAGFVLAIIVFGIAALGVIFSGAYNVAATAPHTRVSAWFLDTAKRRSIEVRGRSVQAPQQLTEEQALRGFKEFNEMCITCHGAPGKEPSEAGKGLLPEPPDLSKIVQGWDRSHLFWIVKNGIKMTGMPAFGRTHDDSEIWDIVAFIEKLPTMTAEQYGRMEGTPNKPPHTHAH
jgi:mono/diheme cytochrome c family protein